MHCVYFNIVNSSLKKVKSILVLRKVVEKRLYLNCNTYCTYIYTLIFIEVNTFNVADGIKKQLRCSLFGGSYIYCSNDIA